MFRCKRRIEKMFYEEKEFTESPKLKVPWLWIGAMTHTGEVLTYTDQINALLKEGETVDHSFLKTAIDDQTIQHWKYLCPQTLEEKHFPSEGFVIENDSKQSSTSQKIE